MTIGVRRRRLLGFGAFLVLVLATAGVATAQPRVELELGLGGNVVVNAWNPIRLTARDVPLGSRMEVTFDHGSLREGQVPFRLSLPVAGGQGLSVVESTVFVAPYQTITWALLGNGAVVASGSMGGRDQDDTPLDVVLSRRSGELSAALPARARVIDVSAAQLPLDSAAYDGVRSLIVDGTAAPPRLEALAAAATAGALVVVSGEMPASHSELGLLTADGAGPLGAGAVVSVSGSPADVARAVTSFPSLSLNQMVSAVAARPLVTPPSPLGQQPIIVVAAVFSLAAVLITRLFGGPGLLAAVLLAALLSVAAWQAARPPAPQVVGSRTLAFIGGELALANRLEEHYTLPATTVDAGRTTRPLFVRPYTVDEYGLHLDLASWRSVVLAMAPEIVEAPLVYEDGVLVNRGSLTLTGVLVVGLGPQGDLAPAQRAVPAEREDGPAPDAYAGLLDLLSPGTVVALSGCDVGCTVWIAPGLVTGARES